MSEKSMKQIASNVEVKVPKTDVGDKIIKLKKQKAAAKTAFTKCKNKLYNLIEQVDVPSRREVRDEIDKRWIFETQRQESVEVLREWILQESEFQVIASEVINGVAEKQRCDMSYTALRTVPVVITNGHRRITVNALLDDASTQTYINEDIAAELGLQGHYQKVSVNVLNGRKESFESMTVNFGLESIDGSVDVSMSALTTTKVTGKMQVVDWEKHGHKWKHLNHIKFPKLSSRTVVDVLIGIDYIDLHRSYEEVGGGQGEPVARLAPLGWTCIGRVHGENETHFASTFLIDNNRTELQNLNALVHKFWEVEEFSCSTMNDYNDDELCAVEKVKQTLQYNNGHYQVGIPWRFDTRMLPDNYKMAVNRLLSTEKKLSKDKEMAEAYCSVLDQYVQKGYIRKVSSLENESKWFLPHFPVVRPDRTTTKVRIVFDASAKCQGVSLNDIIHPGPKLQNDLFEILLRFRKQPIALVCDISEMYLQIEVKPEDRKYLRFLWRPMNSNEEPQVYEFNRVLFGLNCSPFLAQYISQEHAKAHQNEFPLAVETVVSFTYMDDSMDSVEDDMTGIELYNQLSELWRTAGMNARKWLSNSLDVLDGIPLESRAQKVNINKNELPSVKTLGLMWIANDDEFSFCMNVPEDIVRMTKRMFLSEIARIFDPLGLLTPFTIVGKMMIQEMWISGFGWDEELDPDLNLRTLKWVNEVKELCNIRVPRCLRIKSEIENKTFHVFADASQDAYGAAIYAVYTYQSGELVSRLVTSKSRVAPLQSVSIPRMELMAAGLGVKLFVASAKVLEMSTVNTYFLV
ncbi:uncharacterized protein LOC124277021 [Haliotis rubra]|uniref:uncharacterized protein LOC124277021 n=1 Tax=Haliotis rubra TaxID=36100 RepID=UPI001EE61EB6|nr:uncharacterized protein LOC124277021 [Haliotis rubra]